MSFHNYILFLRLPLLCFLFLHFTVLSSRAQQASSSQETLNHKNAAYMGVGSCSSSNCHGSVSPREATNVLQNEYTIWEKHDVHSKAWINLTNQDSKKIGQHLGIAAPEKEPLCLSCHATYLSDSERQGANFHIEDGVGCESCHGAAEKYLGPHTANDATHASNLENGMRDITPLDRRVELCATCHFGGEDKFVNHRLIGAGHPRMTFELDTFSMIAPRHWVVDDDYKTRKSAYNSAQAWLVGQIHLSQKTVERLSSAKLSHDGVWPELTTFYCFSCHHSLKEEQWKKRNYQDKPGELQLNVASLVMLREALAILNPRLSEELAQSLKLLHQNAKKGEISSIIAKLKAQISSAKHEGSNPIKNPSCKGLIIRLVNFCSSTHYLQYELAEQVAMGISALTTSIREDGSLYKLQIEQLYESLKDPKAFVAENFTSACKSFAKSL